MRYFLITDHISDGTYEYYNEVLVRTEMTTDQLNSNYRDCQQNYLAWQFGDIHLDTYSNKWESDNRVVSVYSFREVSDKDFRVLDKYNKSFSLEQIIKDGEETFEKALSSFQLNVTSKQLVESLKGELK